MPTVNLKWQDGRCPLIKEFWWERGARREAVLPVLTTWIRAKGKAKINNLSNALAETEVNRLSNAGRKGRLCRGAILPTNLVNTWWDTYKIILNLCARRWR